MKKILILLLLFVSNLSWVSVKISNNRLNFYYQNKNAQTVSIVFSFDNYTKIYHMSFNQDTHIFSLVLDENFFNMPLNEGTYYYKLLIDGIYTYDYSNENIKRDPFLGNMSYFKIHKSIVKMYDGPIKIDQRNTYRFFFNTDSINDQISNVFLVGTFNNWRPYEISLQKYPSYPKTWYVDIPINEKGEYEYMFIVDGRWIRDTFNPLANTNPVYQSVSILHVE